MARPLSGGLRYFPFDVDFFSDVKIKSVRAHFGADGITLYMYLLCAIYDKGYYIKVDEDFTDCAAADLGQTVDKTRQIMKFFCKRSLFDDTLFTADTILTAASVQRRYQEARKGSKRDIFVDAKLWLLDETETLGFIKVRPEKNYSENNGSFSEKNPDNSANYSTKESKVKEKKVNESSERSAHAALTPKEQLTALYGGKAVDEYERRFQLWQSKNGAKAEMYSTIGKWLKADGVQKPENRSSFDVEDIMKQMMKKYENV